LKRLSRFRGWLFLLPKPQASLGLFQIKSQALTCKAFSFVGVAGLFYDPGWGGNQKKKPFIRQ